MRVRSAATSDEDNDFVNASNSVVSGRVFFFGGISPRITRSCTSTQVEKLVGIAGSNLSAVKSRPPFFTSASWHSTQCFSTNRRLAGGRSAAATAAVAAKSKLNRAKTFMPSKRYQLATDCRLLASFSDGGTVRRPPVALD